MFLKYVFKILVLNINKCKYFLRNNIIITLINVNTFGEIT